MPKEWGKISGVRPIKLLYYLAKEGFTNQEIEKYLINKQKLNTETAKLLIKLYELEQSVFSAYDKQSVALYIHIPFCKTRCTYCSFVSKSNFYTPDLLNTYIEHLLIELRHLTQFITSHDLKLISIYIGGGTPTILNESMLEEILLILKPLIKPGLEFTIEAGRPNTITLGKLDLMDKYSVTRICINPQTMNDKTLVKVNRKHTSNDIREAIKQVNKYKMLINMDMIVGLPGENDQDILYSLDEIIKLNPDEITIHSLAIKRASDMSELNIKTSALVYDKIEQRLINTYQPYYLYKQRNSLYNQANIGYTKNKPCLYNMAMINEQFSILSCGAGAITKILDSKKSFTRFNAPKDVKLYLDNFNEFIDRKKRWFNDAN